MTFNVIVLDGILINTKLFRIPFHQMDRDKLFDALREIDIDLSMCSFLSTIVPFYNVCRLYVRKENVPETLNKFYSSDKFEVDYRHYDI